MIHLLKQRLSELERKAAGLSVNDDSRMDDLAFQAQDLRNEIERLEILRDTIKALLSIEDCDTECCVVCDCLALHFGSLNGQRACENCIRNYAAVQVAAVD